MVITLVPALEEQAIVSAFDQVETEHLCVIGGGQFEVGSTDVDVGELEDSHACTVRFTVPHAWEHVPQMRDMSASVRGVNKRRHLAVGTLGSVGNAARVLKAFTPNEREWGVTDLARRLSIAKSTAHRLLATLTDEGLLEQDPATGRYRLGLVVFDMAAAAQSVDLHEAVLTPMTELRNRTGETVQVAVLDGREVVYVERLDSPNTLRLFLEVGRRNCGALHRVRQGAARLPAARPARTRAAQLEARDQDPAHDHRAAPSLRTRPGRGPPARLRGQPARVRGRDHLGGGAHPRRVGPCDRRHQRRRPCRAARTARARSSPRRRSSAPRSCPAGSATGARSGSPDVRVAIGTFDSLPTDACVAVGDGTAVAVRVGDAVCAYRNRCAHQDSPLAGGIVRNGVLSCPLHFWRYHADTGQLVGTRRRLEAFPVEVVDGEVFVELPDAPPPRSLRDQLLDRARTYDRARAFAEETGADGVRPITSDVATG